MNETTKKVGLIIVVIVAVSLAIYEGRESLLGPTMVYKEIGHGVKGHGMKAQERAEEAAAAAAMKNGEAPSPTLTRDDLAGPTGK